MRITLMRNNLILIGLLLVGCTSRPAVLGFDTEEWLAAPVCSEARMKLAQVIVANEVELLSYTQPTIEALLGSAPKHELHGRNEKFFYYPLTIDCSDSSANQSLFFRFDALGRTKEILIILD